MLRNITNVTLAEWLTRWPAKPFPFGSAGSSPAGDDFLLNNLVKVNFKS